MNFKYVLVLIIISTAVVAVAINGNETYVHGESTLILKPDGTYHVDQETSFDGDYHRYDDRIELEIPFGVLVLRRSGADLIDQDADVWSRI